MLDTGVEEERQGTSLFASRAALLTLENTSVGNGAKT